MAKARLEKTIDSTLWAYLHYGEGRPIFLFHGLNINAGMCEGLALALTEKGFQVIVPDFPGFGFTPKLKNNIYKNVSRELSKFIRSFGFDQVDIYGHSLGGSLALHVGYNNQDIVNTIYTSSPYWRKGGVKLNLIEDILLGISFLPPALTRRMLKPVLINPALKIAKVIDPQLKKPIENNYDDILESANMIDIIGSREVYHSLGRDPIENNIEPPFSRTLIFWAMEDKLILEKEVRALKERIKWPLVKIKNENHNILVDNPNLISEIIYNYSFNGEIIENENIEVERP